MLRLLLPDLDVFYIQCLTPVVESFLSDLLRLITNHWADVCLGPCEVSTTELFYENSQRL